MKRINVNLLLLIVLIIFSACNEKTINEAGEKSENNIEAEENEGGVSPVTLTSQQVQALSIKADTMPLTDAPGITLFPACLKNHFLS